MKFVESFLFITIAAASVFSTTASPCQSDNDCPATQLCENGECSDPCSGFNESFIGNCTVINHKVIIGCPKGYVTRPHVLGCIREIIFRCETNDNCPSTTRCRHNLCVDECRDLMPTLYPYHGDCYMENHEAQIACHDGYHKVPCSFECAILPTAGSKKEGDSCSRSKECKHTLVCTDGKCVDPCNDWPWDRKQYCETYGHDIVDTRCVQESSNMHPWMLIG